MRILILDDDLDRHATFKRKLIGAIIHSVEESSHCIEKIKKEDPFDLILLDHDLGGQVYVPSGPGTGFEVAEWLRDHPEKMPKLVILHTCNEHGAGRMLEVLPDAYYAPALFMANYLDINYLKNIVDKIP